MPGHFVLTLHGSGSVTVQACDGTNHPAGGSASLNTADGKVEISVLVRRG